MDNLLYLKHILISPAKEALLFSLFHPRFGKMAFFLHKPGKTPWNPRKYLP
jgi:hypothetical protein